MRVYSEIPHHFGVALQKARQEAGLSQEALAELAGLDRSYISLLEQGKRQPSIRVLFQISDAMGVAPASFIQILDTACPSSSNYES